MSADAQSKQKPTTIQPLISINNRRVGMFEVCIFCACLAALGVALDDMVGLCFCALYCTSPLLSNILQLYVVQIAELV
jgi:hypothetical protein